MTAVSESPNAHSMSARARAFTRALRGRAVIISHSDTNPVALPSDITDDAHDALVVSYGDCLKRIDKLDAKARALYGDAP